MTSLENILLTKNKIILDKYGDEKKNKEENYAKEKDNKKEDNKKKKEAIN